MEITEAWLTKQKACREGVEWWEKCGETKDVAVLKKLIKGKYLPWANWLIVRVMTYRQFVRYAVYAAEQVLPIYEKKYPKDDRPRKAIEAAKKCIDNPSEENKKAAAASANAATAYAASAATSAAYAAAYASAAAYAAASAADASAADASAAAYTDAYADMRIKILNYGIKLLEGGEG